MKTNTQLENSIETVIDDIDQSLNKIKGNESVSVEHIHKKIDAICRDIQVNARQSDRDKLIERVLMVVNRLEELGQEVELYKQRMIEIMHSKSNKSE